MKQSIPVIDESCWHCKKLTWVVSGKLVPIEGRLIYFVRYSCGCGTTFSVDGRIPVDSLPHYSHAKPLGK